MRKLSASVAYGVFAIALLGGTAAWPQHLVYRDSLPSAPEPQDQQQQSQTQQAAPQQSGTQTQQPQLSQHDQAEKDVKAEEKQRMLGMVPMFNSTDNNRAVPLSVGQKYDLAFHSAIDPAAFVIAGLDAGLSEATDSFTGYGWGAQGYAKRYGAAYADSFIGTMLSNAVVPALVKQDPRYFRMGHAAFRDQGPHSHEFRKRAAYALSTSFRARSDTTGKWQFNYGNIVGNLAGGGISNLYYDQQDRGFGLTMQRFSTNIVEGMLGAMFLEFYPDIHDKVFHKKKDADDGKPSLSGEYQETQH